MCKHWSNNRNGYCLADTCSQVVGNLEHILVLCPTLEAVRSRLRNMWLFKSLQLPALHCLLRRVLSAPPAVQVQFILDPCTTEEIVQMWEAYGQPLLEHVFYLCRAYAYYIHRQKLILLGRWPGPTKTVKHYPNNASNSFSISGPSSQTMAMATDRPSPVLSTTRPSLDLPPKSLIVNQDIVPERSCLAPAVCMTPSTCSLAPCYQPLRHQFAGPMDVPDLGCAGAVGSVGAVAQQFKTGTITSTSQSNIKSASALSLSCPTRVETA